MPHQKVVYKNNFPLFTVLGLIFIVLKLVGTITWSWWWVLAPFWAPLAVVLGIAIFAVILAFIIQCFK